ncbi:hypothetical protein Achl_0874 [Pseudarthrobacter chlorophenolicus A6]|uniref:Uncharacterized protein n=1 Tax=Pseudarthrobacter chlorophenolicus (strain ATCC 700700 / DSM 12829 / CIP 107037 / JCM 12360 / KCTC 9906 / NCIMB 13794 / A6) TaxID=452863 RepID=B8HCT6_PSECP|nr:hypothetical protein [Pseudarthrobacter chlorophenolicus]ACL38869.1 hypothetical protein Achl_0874 [Pseudarthrobacter chlorophenolicus A6]SDR07643.1 hypothetical protein SAMN04489738_4657 [Pseudarthrobacter chlorophenolicus]
MTESIPGRVRQWFTAAFAFTSPEQAADAMADASRWGWLPALSGVAVGADHARARHDESAPGAG